MEVAFFHDDPISRIPLYDPQSSPGSVDSINSTDAGPVSAIAAVAPGYRQQYNTDFNKSAAVKAMNLPLKSGHLAYSQQNNFGSNIDLRQGALSSGGVITANPSVVSSGSFQHTGVITNSYAQQQQGQISSSNNNSLSVTIPDYTAANNNNTLSTPDLVNMLKANSPDFSQNTQSSIQNAAPFFSRNVTQEQEMYAQGFVRELERLKAHDGSDHDISHSPNSEGGNTEVSQCSVITSGINLAQQQQHHPNHHLQRPQQQHYASPDPYFHEGPSSSGYAMSTIHHMGNPGLHSNPQMGMSPHMVGLKEEQPQTVPVLTNSPPVSPINMEHQEVIKTERKRMRNRLAASKCRKRKLERISRLEEKVNNLKNQNIELSTNANLLRQQVSELKSKVMTHVNSGCQLMMAQQQVAF